MHANQGVKCFEIRFRVLNQHTMWSNDPLRQGLRALPPPSPCHPEPPGHVQGGPRLCSSDSTSSCSVVRAWVAAVPSRDRPRTAAWQPDWTHHFPDLLWLRQALDTTQAATIKSEDILENKRTRELGKLPLRDQHRISPSPASQFVAEKDLWRCLHGSLLR